MNRFGDSIGRALRELFGSEPEMVEAQYNIATQQYKHVLRTIIKGCFKLENVPDTWEVDYLWDNMISLGRVCVFDSPKFGNLALRANLTGYNMYNMPTDAIIVAPTIPTYERKIDIDCVVLRFNHYYTGFENLIGMYAEKLASCDAGIDVNIINSKVAHVFEVKRPNDKKAVEKINDAITGGAPFVVVENYDEDITKQGRFSMQYFSPNVKQNFIATELQDAKRTIMNEFLTLFGINNANTDKKERLNGDEVNANNEELLVNMGVVYDELSKGFEKVNQMFGLQVKFSMPYYDNKLRKEKEFRTSEQERGEDNGSNSTDSSTD